jgi:4-hydroxybenzoyl-CoA thioesterase
MTFTSHQTVRFAHVDAAGIVFYPRYFEMLNAAVEDYFAQSIGVDFAEIHIARKLGVPTVRLEADFSAPSRLGDRLDFQHEIVQVGRSSVELAIKVFCGEDQRFQGTAVLVCMDLASGKSVPWPPDMRPQVI